MREREITNTEEVTGSNPVSPTSITPGQSQIPGSQDRSRRGSRDGCLPNCLPKSPASHAGKRASIALAPRVSTGRSSLRYTSSVTRLLAWPTRWEMSSILIPVLDSNDTKLCRSSRGVHACASSRRPRPPDGASGGCSPRPVRCPPTCRPRPAPCHRSPPPVGRAAGSSGAPGGPAARAGSSRAARLPRLGLPAGRTERHSATGRRFPLEVDARPGQGPQLLGPGAGEKRDHHVRAHRLIGLGRRQQPGRLAAVNAFDGRPAAPEAGRPAGRRCA